MIKKFLILIVSLMSAVGVYAQSTVGSWEVYPNFREPEQVLETPSKVFILSSGSLFSFDKDSEELYHYGTHNVLSEATISKLFYNGKGDYLVVVYGTSNMDVIKKDGKVVNLPDIKDAILQSSRTVNDICFANGRMYVATDFGIVVYDDKKWEVKESGIYNKAVKYIGATDEYLGAYFSNDKKIGFIPTDKTLRYIDNFSLSNFNSCTGLRGLKDNNFLGSTTSTYSPRKIVFDPAANAVAVSEAVSDANYSGPFYCKNGYYIYNTVASGNNIACIKIIDEDYNVTTTNLPSDFSGKKVAMWSNPNEVFIGDGNGISEYSFTENGELTLLHDSFKPEAVTADGVGFLTASNSGKLYISRRGYAKAYEGDFPKVFNISYINLLENNHLKDITPSNLTFSGLRDNQKEGYKDGTYRPSNTFNILEDPDDPDAYWFSTVNDGVYKIKNGKQVAYYNPSNAPFINDGDWVKTDVIDFDGKGNLWVKANKRPVMLPAAKRKGDNQASKEDWISDFPDGMTNYEWDAAMIACKKSNMVIYSSAWWINCMDVIDTKGTDTTSDDEHKVLESFIDQDGKEWNLGNTTGILCLTEDKNGAVWVGTYSGLFIIPDPSKLLDPNMRIQRIKVPRNDGTNFADYLLDGELVLSIAVDGLNRKWIGTYNSGVYLVSENGTQILEHFTTENSYLPIDRVHAIACDKFSNAVYFGTTAGLVKYNSDAAPASEDLSNVYAYPNPVRPEYTGWITVAGLMDGSLVKIADASGNVFFEGTSQGGILTWDGCDKSGNRVKTGVYYVFASNSDGQTSSGAVAKILVVK